MITKRKIISTVLTMGLCLMATATFAKAQKHELGFWVHAVANPAYTDTNPKNDNEAYAYVTTEGTALRPDDFMRYDVVNSAKTKEVSEYREIRGATVLKRQKFKYFNGYNVKGRKYRLEVHSYVRNVYIKGRWNS